MTLSSAELDRIAHLHEGDLAETPFAVLLYALARARRSTAIEIRRGPLRKEIFLEDGVPVDCRSNLVSETLSRFMVSTGRLSATVAEEAFRESVAKSVRFGEILIARGLVTAGELLRILQQNLAHKLLDGFSWRDGRFRLTAETAPNEAPLKVNLPQLILIGVARFATQEQIDSSIAPLIGTGLAINPAPPLPVADSRLPEAHRVLLEALRERPFRIDQLATACKIPYQDLTRDLYALSLIELVVPSGRLAEQPPARPAGRPAADVPSASATAAPVPDQLREELVELALSHRRKDPFELLGVDPSAAGTTAHRRFLAFAEKFAPWKFEGDLAETARELFLAGARAYAQLCDPERRRTLIAARELPSPPPAATPAPRDVFRVETRLLDPETQFRAGMKLVAGGRHAQAIEQLEYAADLDPQNLQYRSELAYCRFRADPEANAIKALEELCEVTRVDPLHGLGLFYTGEILRHAGRLDDAEVFLRRAIRPMTPDRRPIDALRELTRERKALQ